MTLQRKLLLVIICCTAVAWVAGPPGRFLVVLALFLFGPGYLADRWLPPLTSTAAFVRPVFWLGLSVSLVVLLYQATTLIGLALTPPVLAGLAASCGAAVVWCVWVDSASSHAATAPSRNPWPTTPLRWWYGVFGVILLLTLWVRFVQIRDLALPAWVDSVHHAIMIRVAVETGQVPISLEPYLAVPQLPYHWGYHVLTAAVIQLSGVALPLVMLWEGQIFNALHVLACAAMASYLWRRPAAGVVAGLVVGLVSLMPSYYVSWGRYTHLLGMLLLPSIAIMWHAGLRSGSWRWWVGVAVLLAGLSMVHFRILIFALGLVAVISVSWAIDKPWPLVRSRLGRVVAAGSLALGLAAPWLWVVIAQTLLPAIDTPQNLVGSESYNTVNLNLLWLGENRLLVALALGAAFVGLGRRSRTALEQVGWVIAMLVCANPWTVSYLVPAVGVVLALWAWQQRHLLVGAVSVILILLNPALVTLPYLWLITNDAVVISLFMPISVLVGGGVCLLAERFEHLRREATPQVRTMPSPAALHIRSVPARSGILPIPTLLIGLVLVVALWGTWQLRDVINPVTVLATSADVAAIEWVGENTPPDARFLIDATAWLPGVARGTDGGWWLLPLTGRWTSTPPTLFIYGPLDYVYEVQALNDKIVNLQGDDIQTVAEVIADEQITHVYLSPKSKTLATVVAANPTAFETLYEQAGITILAVRQ